MGHMDVLPIISDGFNIYFPTAILGLCLATYFSLGSRFLSFIGFQQFVDDDDDVTAEMADEGRELVKRGTASESERSSSGSNGSVSRAEKRRRQRAENSELRRRHADGARGPRFERRCETGGERSFRQFNRAE